MSNRKTKSQASKKPLISVVVPAFNEAENVENLAAEIAAALASMPYEMIFIDCLLYTSPSPRDATLSRMPSSA